MLFYLYSNKLIKTVDNIPTLYTIYENYFTSYVINYDKCSPKIDISKTSNDDITEDEYKQHLNRMDTKTQTSKIAKQLIAELNVINKYNPTDE